MAEVKMDTGCKAKDKRTKDREEDTKLKVHLEDRPLLSKRRTQVYWKVVAGVVVLHRQPLPSVWVVLLPHPSLPPHPTLQYPSLPPNHLTSLINIHSFFIKLFFFCSTPFPLECNPRNPSQPILPAILTSTIATDPPDQTYTLHSPTFPLHTVVSHPPRGLESYCGTAMEFLTQGWLQCTPM